MLDARQVRDLIIEPTLKSMEMHSPAAVELMMGTALAESGLRAIRQVTDGGYGPACGLFQIEPKTARDILFRYIRDIRPDLRWRALGSLYGRLQPAVPEQTLVRYLTADMEFGCRIARLKYWIRPEPLAEQGDIEGHGNYWKRFYNAGGKGDVAHFYQTYMEIFR